MFKKIGIGGLLTLFLLGCGGSSSENINNKEENNHAPIANADTATSSNNQSVTIDVLANDSDADNDTLTLVSIKSAPEFGTANIDGNKIIYSPNNNYAGSDSLTYTLTDGTFEVDANVSISVNHEFVILGQVYEAGLENATVTLEIGDDVFTSISTTKGKYELNVTINKLDDMLLLKAKGSEAKQHIELVSMLGDSSKILSQISDSGQLTDNTNNRVNLTSVSTARYLLSIDKNSNEIIDNQINLDILNNGISSDNMLNTAGFIHLLIENSEFQVTQGDTTLSLLEKETLTLDSINSYLELNQLTTYPEFNAYYDALEQSKIQLVSHEILFEKISNAQFINTDILIHQGIQPNWLVTEAELLMFNNNGQGKIAHKYRPNLIEDINWTSSNNTLTIDYPETLEIANSFDALNKVFSDTVDYDELLTLYQGFNLTGQASLRFFNINHEIKVLSSTPSQYQVIAKVTQQVEINMGLWYDENGPWQGDNPVFTLNPEFISLSYQPVTYDSKMQNFTLDDLAGDWAVPILYNFKHIQPLIDPEFAVNLNMLDTLTIQNNKAVGKTSKKSFDVSINEGVITLKDSNIKYTILPFKQAGKAYQVLVKIYQEDTLVHSYIDQIAKFDMSYQNFLDNLVTDLPQFHLSYLLASNPKNWHGNQIKKDKFSGFHFKSDGTVQYAIVQNYDDTTYDGTTYNWELNGREISINSYITNRKWNVISVNDLGYALIMESYTYVFDNNNDGEITLGEGGVLITPRFRIVRLEDMTNWPEIWSNFSE